MIKKEYQFIHIYYKNLPATFTPQGKHCNTSPVGQNAFNDESCDV